MPQHGVFAQPLGVPVPGSFLCLQRRPLVPPVPGELGEPWVLLAALLPLWQREEQQPPPVMQLLQMPNCAAALMRHAWCARQQ